MNGKIKYGIIMMIAAIILLILGTPDTLRLLKSPIKLDIESAAKAKSLKPGDHVKADVKLVFDGLMSEITTTKSKYTKEKKSEETSRYYLIPFADFSTSDEWFLTIKVGKENFEKANKGMEALESFMLTGNIPSEVLFTVDGIVKKMNDEKKNYVPSKYNGKMDMIYVDNTKKGVVFVMEGLGLLFLILGTVFISLYIKERKVRKTINENMKVLEQQDNDQISNIVVCGSEDASTNPGTQGTQPSSVPQPSPIPQAASVPQPSPIPQAASVPQPSPVPQAASVPQPSPVPQAASMYPIPPVNPGAPMYPIPPVNPGAPMYPVSPVNPAAPGAPGAPIYPPYYPPNQY